MIISYAVCQQDEVVALSTLEWAHHLDGKLPYNAILSVGEGVQGGPLIAAMEKLFQKVTVLNSSDAPNSWPQGKNATFQNLVRYLDSQHSLSLEGFLWWEPDAIPLKKGWLATLEAEHLAGGKAFTGYVHDALKCMECVGIYPPNFMEYSPITGMLCRAAPWDRCCGAAIIQNVHRANHLMQFVHDIDGCPPTFGTDLSLLRPGAVLFHKNKDGSLIQQLSKGTIRRVMDRVFRKSDSRAEKLREPITVVFAPCAKDIDQAIHHAQWLRQMGRRWTNRALVAVDAECDSRKVKHFGFLLEGVFEEVAGLLYPTPPDKSYPAAANFAFARVAEMMSHGSAPWFWMESDSVVLKADWLEVLQKEYAAADKPFMGPVVKEAGFGHANGSCVYPADAARRIPKALKQTKIAWDYAMREEVDCHDASHLICHVWGLVNGLPSATNGTNPPTNITRDLARKIIPPSSVVVHRIKDNSLVDLLMKGEWK